MAHLAVVVFLSRVTEDWTDELADILNDDLLRLNDSLRD